MDEKIKQQRSVELDAAITAFFQSSALLDQIRLQIWDRENLTVTQLRLLGLLREQEGISNAELADRLYVTRPSVSALLERLERGGFIRREVSQNDRRGINIWLEPRGRQVSESLREESREYLCGLFESLSPEDITAFRESVEKFVASGRARRAKDLAAESANSAS
ncbi:MAG: MarR family transcriptional regulator [Tepidiformaceae bacterium]